MRILHFIFSRRTRWYAVILLIGLILYFVLWAPLPSQRIAPQQVWQVVSQVAPKHGIEPSFVYAIIMAESSLNPMAATDSSRGLMQMSESAWKVVTSEPFDEAWVWQNNIEMGTRYLAFCKQFLEEHGAFSYPRLAACYHMGPGEVEDCHWKMSCVPIPENTIYRELYSGDERPVPIPGS